MDELNHDIDNWVAISGATGFIGRALCLALQQQGYGIIALSRDPARARRVLHKLDKKRSVMCSYSNLDQITPRILINLAGANIAAKRWSKRRKKTLRNSRLQTTSSLIAAAETHWRDKLELVISGSAVGYYGDGGDTTLDENTPPGNDFAAELCQDWEQQIPASEDYRRVIIRLGIVLGPTEDGGALASMRLPFALGLGAQFGNGQHWQSWISRDDVIRAIMHLITHPELNGPFNLVSPQPVSNREFSLCLADTLERPMLLSIPNAASTLLFGEMRSLLLASQRVLPTALLASGFKFRYPELDRAMAKALRAC